MTCFIYLYTDCVAISVIEIYKTICKSNVLKKPYINRMYSY